MSETAIMLLVSAAIATVICVTWPVLRWFVFGPALLIGAAGEAIGDLVDHLQIEPYDAANMLSHGEQIGAPWSPELQSDRDAYAEALAIGAYREAHPDGYYPAVPSETPLIGHHPTHGEIEVYP